jgi:hypothetical protein
VGEEARVEEVLDFLLASTPPLLSTPVLSQTTFELGVKHDLMLRLVNKAPNWRIYAKAGTRACTHPVGSCVHLGAVWSDVGGGVKGSRSRFWSTDSSSAFRVGYPHPRVAHVARAE